MSRQQPTISDIAAHVGLAPTTVAAALRGERRIAAATRERIAQVAAELGYRRNVAASVLGARRPSKRGTIAVTLLVRLAGGVQSRYARPFKQYFSQAGWVFQVVNLMDFRDPVAAGNRLHQQGVDAVILGPTTPTDLQLPEFPWNHFAVISITRQHVALGYDVVRINHYSSMIKLARQVHTLGYRRIGVLHRTHSPRLEDDDARLAAILLLQHHAPSGGPHIQLYHLPFRPEPDLPERSPAVFDRWIRRHRLDVIVGFNASDLEFVQATGREVPRDIAFAALHTFRTDQPAVSGLAAPPEFLAPLVAMRLEHKLKLGDKGLSPHPFETVSTPDFLAGESLPGKATP